MTVPAYRTIADLLTELPQPNRESCLRLLADLDDQRLRIAPGSSHNHQAWPGGYYDHIAETMNIATVLYPALVATGRPLPFTLADALLVLFLHDLEKPWKYLHGVPGAPPLPDTFGTKPERQAFRFGRIAAYFLKLTDEQRNALSFVEGEGDAYSGKQRTMGELAAFCHMCDVWSARGWHDRPAEYGDEWSGATRLIRPTSSDAPTSSDTHEP